jgi:RNA polymerase sigma-70 factor, ECF subfamily
MAANADRIDLADRALACASASSTGNVTAAHDAHDAHDHTRNNHIPGDDDAALVARARAGDREAEAALYRRHGPRLLARTSHLLGDAAEAEDIVQDVFVTAFAQLDRLRVPAAFGGWILRAAVRRVWGISRWRRVRRRFGLDHSAITFLTPHPAISPEERALLAELDLVLARLPTSHRIAWSLRIIEGLTLDEVAAACDCSLATAKRHIARAQLAIRDHLGDSAPALLHSESEPDPEPSSSSASPPKRRPRATEEVTNDD